ncbi:MAG: MarR family transcriptional regulator [Hydrococcus sp. RU_2_2]|nr:MarR family transcriptional regulator [Hydrococcus sp. RU_2_2]NJP19849.1 MarR family transcriptional regulator [Hydrococcus sp. CRU_1_1]NJQ96753.1 MarR family transcriptional regulator [Hydrococcus sp. CSU_1_8]
MTQAKIDGKFYPLQHEEWLRACRELTPAQRDVLYYLRTLAPYGTSLDLTAAEIARQLSTPERTVHRQTVSRALKELDRKGFVDLELIKVEAKVNPKGLWCDETPRCDETPQEISTHHSGSSDTTVDRQTPQWIVRHHAEAETPTKSEFQNSKIYKINKNIKTLSEEGERENLNLTEEKKPEVENSSELTAKKQESFQQLLEKQKDFEVKDSSELTTKKQESSQQLLKKQKDSELELNSAAPLNKNLQKDGRFSPQYQKVLDALPDAKSYLEWAYKRCGDGLPAYPTYPSRVIENNHHDLIRRYRQELETLQAIARSSKTQAAKEKSPSETVFADPETINKLILKAMKRV